MKKQDFAKLALLGLASGLFVNGQLSANENHQIEDSQIFAQLNNEGKKLLDDIDANQKAISVMAAKPACKGAKGCPGITASRDLPKSNLQDPSKLADAKTSSAKSSTDKDNYGDDPNNGNLGYHLMTEDELLLELNDEATKLYNSLSPEGKALAREVASQRCNGTNDCKGLNACQTEHNKCAGQGSCKGTSKCAFSDKNLAVKVVAKKMAEKRNGALKNSGSKK